jgi:hypothetical protein
MKELSFEQMEEIQGGMSLGCGIAMVTYAGALAGIAYSTAGAGIPLAIEAFNLGMSALGIGYGCKQEIMQYFGVV